MRSDYREFQYCIPEARDGYNLGTASGSQISECLNPAVTRYVITWARFELCPRYKSPSSVTRRGASIGLTWLPNRPKPLGSRPVTRVCKAFQPLPIRVRNELRPRHLPRRHSSSSPRFLLENWFEGFLAVPLARVSLALEEALSGDVFSTTDESPRHAVILSLLS